MQSLFRKHSQCTPWTSDIGDDLLVFDKARRLSKALQSLNHTYYWLRCLITTAWSMEVMRGCDMWSCNMQICKHCWLLLILQPPHLPSTSSTVHYSRSSVLNPLTEHHWHHPHPQHILSWNLKRYCWCYCLFPVSIVYSSYRYRCRAAARTGPTCGCSCCGVTRSTV